MPSFFGLPSPPRTGPQDTNACCFGEGLLIIVEGQEGVGSNFDRDGDVEEVHPTDRDGETVLGTEFAPGADGIPPVEFRVWPVTKSDFLFEKADQFARLARDDDARALKLAQRIEKLRRAATASRGFGCRESDRRLGRLSSVILQAIHHDVSP